MSTHNICFHEEIRENISTLQLEKMPYIELLVITVLCQLCQMKGDFVYVCKQKRPISSCVSVQSDQGQSTIYHLNILAY